MYTVCSLYLGYNDKARVASCAITEPLKSVKYSTLRQLPIHKKRLFQRKEALDIILAISNFFYGEDGPPNKSVTLYQIQSKV